MKCNGCNEVIPDNSKTCPNCGREQNIFLGARNWICPKCKKMNGPERSSCWNCG